ncbi:MAG: TolC family protein [Prevotella sp.]|nr:TolC family protein [Prevotella sp.]
MRKLLLVIFMLPMISQAQTLEECQQAAERNYPLIRQYDLISRTASLNVENIAKGWLPQVTASAQATLQSDVVSWPEQVKGMYQQLGIDMKGLRKDQYKIAVDVSQMVYDGGTIRSQKELALLQGAVEEAQTEVSMYQVRKQVNEMYFALLLLDEQIRLNSDLQELLSSNERKLASMLKRGTAAESDYNAVKAERLGVSQQATNLQSQRQSLLTLLSTFCGIQVSKVEKPAAVVPTQTQPTQRPELKLVQAQLSFADAQEKLLDASLKPRLSVFASGFYGYPGYNMFEDMMNRNWSLGGIIGARLSWNIGALYTRKNDKTKIQLQRDRAMNSRDVFLFNNRLDMVRQQNDMDRHRKLMAVDEEMISLRSSVRKAAESKLAHGIIDVNGLVKEINAENAARVQLSVHEIEMLKEIYNLKYTINN